MFEPGVTTVALLSGPLVLLGYLLGSVPVAYLWRRRELRGALDRGELAGRARAGREGEEALVGVEALLALAAAHIAWQVIESVAPGGQGGIPSSIGVLSEQVLAVWQSVALWAGFAAVLGHVAPVWLRFRGGTGVPPALLLSFVYLPLVFGSAVIGFFAGLALTRNRRLAIVAALPVALTTEWLAWVFDLPDGWGMRSGPEACLWVFVTGLVLIARNAFDPQWDLPWLPPREPGR